MTVRDAQQQVLMSQAATLDVARGDSIAGTNSTVSAGSEPATYTRSSLNCCSKDVVIDRVEHELQRARHASSGEVRSS